MIQNIHQILLGLKGLHLGLALAFAFLFLIRWIYLFLFTGRVLFQKKTNGGESRAISLFYTVRNEEDRLKKNLVPVLSINQPEFEVIVVNNCSQDNSFQVLGMLKGRSDRLKISTLYQEIRFSTKMAQNLALKAAKYDWAIAVPISFENAGEEWISTISKALDENKTLAINYCSVNHNSGFVNLFYRVESFLSFLKSTGYILNNLPFVYFEENVAFRKKKYFDLGGHAMKINEPYAHLELIFNQFISKKETAVLFKAETAIYKTEDLVWNEYADLIKKNLRVEKHLNRKMKTILAIDETTKLLFPVATALVFVFMFELWPVFGSMLFLMLTSRLFIIKIAQNRLKERKIFIPSLVYDLIIPYFKLFYRLYFNKRRQKMRWKM